MPFDLDKTHHTFEQDDKGGVESVRALDPKDSAQIRLIRSHLQLEATKFAAGDFSDPTAIHGTAVAGVAALSAGAKADRLTIEYAELPGRGEDHLRERRPSPGGRNPRLVQRPGFGPWAARQFELRKCYDFNALPPRR